MTWMLTHTGREHHLSGIGQQLNVPTIEEIAHALAQINRFTGHCSRPYSVAEHSLLVAQIAATEGASPAAQLAALLHDAHEAYVGDVSSPAKWSVGVAWEAFEHAQAVGVHAALGVRKHMQDYHAAVRRWDLMALATERRDLTSYNPTAHTPWAILDTPGQVVAPWARANLKSSTREQRPWHEWVEIFLDEYRYLITEVARVQRGQA